MKAILAVSLLGIAILAVPAATPASQPQPERIATAMQMGTTTIADLGALLADPHVNAGDFSITLPVGYASLDWIDRDPFAL